MLLFHKCTRCRLVYSRQRTAERYRRRRCNEFVSSDVCFGDGVTLPDDVVVIVGGGLAGLRAQQSSDARVFPPCCSTTRTRRCGRSTDLVFTSNSNLAASTGTGLP